MLAGYAYGYVYGYPAHDEPSAVILRAIEWVDVVEIDATLSVVPLVLQEVIIDLVLEIVSVRAFGGESSKRTRAVRLLLAAHMATVWRQAASGAHSGPETSRSGLSISKSFAATSMTPDGLTRSAHGQMYLMLVRSSPLTQGLRA